MTEAFSILAGLLAECNAHGIRMAATADGGLTIDAPRQAITPDLVARLKAHKAELVALLEPTPEVVPVAVVSIHEFATATPTKRPAAPCRCGGAECRDVPIHGGRSARRDCARCGRFVSFPIWYGNHTLQSE